MIASNLKRSDPPTSNGLNKPLASISLDLDNQWSYMKTHGDPGWEKFPSYFGTFIPKVLDILDRMNLKITFFVVGQDAALDKNREMLGLLAARGHEVGNHSFSHEPWLHRYPKNQIRQEVSRSEESIYRATGEKPTGFRGPGFSWSRELIEVLIEKGYVYDASTLPTFIGPLARMYYFCRSNLTKDEKALRKGLFGDFTDGFKSLKPYCWKLNSSGRLLEIPVTTIPFIKTPFHLSYLLYLSTISLDLVSFYLKTAITLCKMTGTEPSFLLHPLDFLGGDQMTELVFFPGMDIPESRKISLFQLVVSKLSNSYTLGDMRTHVQSIQNQAYQNIVYLKK